jgi:hypothetical protein
MNLVQRTGLRLGVLLAAAALGATGPASAQEKLAPGSTQRVQGSIHADAGRGMVELTSRATTLPDNLGQQAAARLQTSEGQAAVQKGDARAKAATGRGVSAGDVQAIADHYAGKTVYDSTMRSVKVIARYLLTLDAKAAGGPRVALALELDEKTLAPVSASVSYYPDSKDLFNNFKTGKKAPATVRIEKIERVGDKVFAVSGSFSAADLQPGAMSKKLQGQTLPAVSGRFAFTEVPVLDK